MSVFDALISSRTRIQILMHLFLDPSRQAYLRQLARDFSIAPSQVGDELHQLRDAGLLIEERQGKQVLFRANSRHPLFPELSSMVRKALGTDRILESIVSRLGNLERAVLLDDYAEGRDSGLVDLLLIGNIDQHSLADLVAKTERYVKRKIRVLVLTRHEYAGLLPTLSQRPQLTIWVAPGDANADTDGPRETPVGIALQEPGQQVEEAPSA